MPIDQVPEDVLALARKAGVDDFEWYSGRFDVAEDDSNDRQSVERRAELRRLAEDYRRQSKDRSATAVAPMALTSRLRSVAMRLRLWRPRHAR